MTFTTKKKTLEQIEEKQFDTEPELNYKNKDIANKYAHPNLKYKHGKNSTFF